MGDLLNHISPVDTVRDLEYLRELVGDEKITYVDLSYGTMIGQMYANMFPDRVRAMLLAGIVDPVAFTTSAEAMTAVNSSSTDEVFAQFLRLCDSAGPERCALAGHGVSATNRVAGLFAQAEQAPIRASLIKPAPNPAKRRRNAGLISGSRAAQGFADQVRAEPGKPGAQTRG